jgi:hypothetical protein
MTPQKNQPEPNNDGLCLIGSAIAISVCYLILCLLAVLIFSAVKPRPTYARNKFRFATSTTSPASPRARIQY